MLTINRFAAKTWMSWGTTFLMLVSLSLHPGCGAEKSTKTSPVANTWTPANPPPTAQCFNADGTVKPNRDGDTVCDEVEEREDVATNPDDPDTDDDGIEDGSDLTPNGNKGGGRSGSWWAHLNGWAKAGVIIGGLYVAGGALAATNLSAGCDNNADCADEVLPKMDLIFNNTKKAVGSEEGTIRGSRTDNIDVEQNEAGFANVLTSFYALAVPKTIQVQVSINIPFKLTHDTIQIGADQVIKGGVLKNELTKENDSCGSTSQYYVRVAFDGVERCITEAFVSPAEGIDGNRIEFDQTANGFNYTKFNMLRGTTSRRLADKYTRTQAVQDEKIVDNGSKAVLDGQYKPQ